MLLPCVSDSPVHHSLMFSSFELGVTALLHAFDDIIKEWGRLESPTSWLRIRRDLMNGVALESNSGLVQRHN